MARHGALREFVFEPPARAEQDDGGGGGRAARVARGRDRAAGVAREDLDVEDDCAFEPGRSPRRRSARAAAAARERTPPCPRSSR